MPNEHTQYINNPLYIYQTTFNAKRKREREKGGHVQLCTVALAVPVNIQAFSTSFFWHTKLIKADVCHGKAYKLK